MRSKTSMDRARELSRDATKAAADMELISLDEGERLARYYLRGRWWSWAEVVVLRGGHLLVHGDVDAVIFGCCHGEASPRGVLGWMAYAGPQYAEEKASIGSSGKIGKEFDASVALGHVLDWRRQRDITKDQARYIHDGLCDGWGQHEFIEALAGDGVDNSERYDAGEVTERRVFSAQAILRQLIECLERRDFRGRSQAWFRRSAA